MDPILVVFDTHHGQSARIARRIEERIRARGLAVDLEQTPGHRPLSIEDTSAVIVVAPVYNRRHTDSIEWFVSHHARDLSMRPTTFISVSIGAASRLRVVKRGIRRIATQLFHKSGWHPSRDVYVGGSLDYPIYEPAICRWMQAAAFLFGLPTDTSRRHELTSWSEVDEATDALLLELEETTDLDASSCCA